MKVCPSCGSPAKEFEITDPCEDTLFAFHPSPAPPGYTVDDTRMDDSFAGWDFSTRIACCECGEETVAGEILEPEPVLRSEYQASLDEAAKFLALARQGREPVANLEFTIDALVHAKNLAACGIKE